MLQSGRSRRRAPVLNSNRVHHQALDQHVDAPGGGGVDEPLLGRPSTPTPSLGPGDVRVRAVHGGGDRQVPRGQPRVDLPSPHWSHELAEPSQRDPAEPRWDNLKSCMPCHPHHLTRPSTARSAPPPAAPPPRGWRLWCSSAAPSAGQPDRRTTRSGPGGQRGWSWRRRWQSRPSTSRELPPRTGRPLVVGGGGSWRERHRRGGERPVRGG